MKRKYAFDIHWIAFPLRPDTPVDGLSLEQLFAGRGVSIKEVSDRLERVAREEGLPFGERKKTYNSRLAQELGKWAEAEGRGEPFHLAAFQAYFVDGINIARISHLGDLAAKAGLSREEARDVLESRRFREAVDADWALSRERDVVAAPTFMVDGNRLVGAQSYDVLERFLVKNHVRRRIEGR